MFGPDVDAAVKAHAIAEYPRECCGLVIDGKYTPFPNVLYDPNDVTTNPYDAFQLPVDAWPTDGRVVNAVLHSHCAPRWGIEPSAADMKSQIATAVPWGIVLASRGHASDPVWFGDHLLDEPLLGRQFLHGVRDCYSLVRSEKWQRDKIKLPEFPRDVEWWKKGGDLYRTGFASAGYKQIAPGDARPGDVVLMTVRSPVTNHAAIVLDGGLMMHHLQNKLSHRVPIGPWLKLITHWLRYEG